MTPDWPRARDTAGPAGAAVIKALPEYFQVTELPLVEPEGAGEHLLLRLEKTNLTTPELARWLAGEFAVPEVAVGYAGMKDARAVTDQWFSVHTAESAERLGERPGVRLLAADRQRRKLRRGELAGNRFRIRLAQVRGTHWAAALSSLRDDGAPNYFGSQRFARNNLAQARDWLADRRRRRIGRFRSGLYLSVLRSYLFNEVLAARVRDGSWQTMIDGDVPAGPEAGPSGPLWGRGRSAASGRALAIEQAALADLRTLCDGLEHAGLTQDRRALRLRAPDLEWRRDGDELELTFTLPPGGYATVLLGDVFALSEAPADPADGAEDAA